MNQLTKMNLRTPIEPDALIRRVFDCEPEAATRAARRALAAPDRRRRRDWWTLAAVALLAGMIFGPALWRPEQSPDPHSPSAGNFSGFLEADVLVVRLPDGSVSIASGESRTDRLPDGSGFVLVEGGIE